MKKLLFYILLALLVGCTHFTPKPVQLDIVDIPEQFSLYSEPTEISPEWWTEFNNQELTSLIEIAIEDNFSIKEAWSRLEEARSTARKLTAQSNPDLGSSFGDSYSSQKSNDQESTSTTWSLGLSSSYEVDLWGRVQAENTSINLQTEASAEDVNTAIISVSSQIAETWTSLVSSKKQQSLYEEQLEVHNRLQKLLRFRLAKGQSSTIDIYKQQQTIEKIETSLLQISSQREIYSRQLALLCGKTTLRELTSNKFPILKNIPSLGLPADLLADRPDVRAAGLLLQSSQWQVAVAQSDRLPALRLSASLAYSAEELQSLFDSWLSSLAVKLSIPIYDANKKEAEIHRTRAVVDQRLFLYRQKVYTAVKEVEDALGRETLHTKSLASLREQIRLSETTIQDALQRYLNSSGSFINVLEKELEMLQLQQQQIITEENLITARINLYKALGGSKLPSTDS